MGREQLTKLFPAFDEIGDISLRGQALRAMDMAMEKGGWNEDNIALCPVTLTWKNCDVSWVEHVSDVAAVSIANYAALGKYYKRHGVNVNRDIVIAGALLHDIGKLTEFACSEGRAVYRKNHELMRHPLSGAVIAGLAGLPDILIHLIATHSFEGDKSYQTPESAFVRSSVECGLPRGLWPISRRGESTPQCVEEVPSLHAPGGRRIESRQASAQFPDFA